MSQHTINLFIQSTPSSGWNNINNIFSRTDNPYASSEAKYLGGEASWIGGWTAERVTNYTTSYATINSITINIRIKLASTGTGTMHDTYYKLNYNSGASDAWQSIGDNGFNGDSWSTISFSLSGNLNLVKTQGFCFKSVFENRAAKKQSINIAYVTADIVYTIPDITYTYRDWDGTTLKTETVEQGTSPTAPSSPTRDADAEYTYTFSGWSLSGTTYTAQYTATKRSYVITVGHNGNGTVTGGGTYEYGTTVTLTAIPNSGYKFKQWVDEVTTASRTITVTENATYSALFEAYEGICIYYGAVPVTNVYLGNTKITSFYYNSKQVII